MRILVAVVTLMVVLAGCSQPSPPPEDDRPDPSQALYNGPTSAQLQQFGPQVNSTLSVPVIGARCGAQDNVYAYTINATGQGSLSFYAPLAVPNATSYLIAAFEDTPDGLAVASWWRGGLDAHIQPAHQFGRQDWEFDMPSSFTVAAGDDGMVRVLIACRGEGAVNYASGLDEVPEYPDYQQPIVTSGFDSFLAVLSSGIYIGLGAPGIAPAWTTVGNVVTEYEQIAPAGVRVGTTTIEWSGGGPGWATVDCFHQGWSDHGSWSYEAKLHGQERSFEGTMAQDVATLWITQDILFGDIAIRHTDSGPSAGNFRFEVEHLASAEILSTTECTGAHVAAPLETLFGVAAAKEWVEPRPFV